MIGLREMTCVVNGERRPVGEWRGVRLLDYLRQGVGLTATKEGCSEGECGACTVLLDGAPVCSCLILTDTVVGRAITTVEGLDPEFVTELANVIESVGGVQCGYCTPGFTMMANWIADQDSVYDVPSTLEGNLCRCTGYSQLVEAIGQVAEGRCRRGRRGDLG